MGSFGARDDGVLIVMVVVEGVDVWGVGGEGGTFWVFLGLMMVLIVEVVLVVEEEGAGEGELTIMHYS